MFFPVSMSNKQNDCAVNKACRLPTVFATFYPVLFHQREGIGENASRSFETHAMFTQIGFGLFRIPLKSQFFHIA